jgi:hypothetical protein
MAISPATFDPNREPTDEVLAALSLRPGAVPWDPRPLFGSEPASREDRAQLRDQISERFMRTQAVQHVDAIRMPAPTLLARNREVTTEGPQVALPRALTVSGPAEDAWLIAPLGANSLPTHILKRRAKAAAVPMPKAATAVAATELRAPSTIPVSPTPPAPQAEPLHLLGVSLLQFAVMGLFAAWVAALVAVAANPV